MEFLPLLVGLIVIAVVIGGVVMLARRLKTLNQSEDTRAFELLAKQMEGLSQRIDTSSQSVQSAVQAQLGQSVKIVQDVTERLTRLDETNRQVMGFADQLQRLQNTLNNPKQRGVLGEYYLQTLLSQSFQPNQYKLQYKFKDGSIVDAVLHFGDKLIPIDSKFSLENYNRIVDEQDPTERQRLEEVFRRDLKERIDETAKYVRPEEGTLEFAFMFIPAEGIYYDLLVNKVGAIKVNTRALLEYAIHEKKVHIVSPTTFYVTLQSLMVGMNAYKIQASTISGLTKTISRNLAGISVPRSTPIT